MRKIREVLRLRYECQRTHRQIAASCDISPASVGEYLKRTKGAGLDWSEIRELSEEQVEARLFRQVGYNEPPLRAAIDFAWLQGELPRTGVTLQLLWSERMIAWGASFGPYVEEVVSGRARLALMRARHCDRP